VVEGAVVVTLQDGGAVGGGLVLDAQDLAAGDVEDLEVARGLLLNTPLLVGGGGGVLLSVAVVPLAMVRSRPLFALVMV
jgi:hypothetical protein